MITLSTPAEFETAIFTVPESLATEFGDDNLLSIDISTSKQQVRDAILPSFYPMVVSSTPFLTSLFDTPVTPTNDDTGTITLYEYMSEHQRSPWWGYLTSLPSKAIGFVMGIFKDDVEEDPNKPLNPFRLTKHEAAVTKALDNRITVGVDKKRRTITLTIRMQDPHVAAIVADSVSSRLKTFITAYRTQKERHNLAFMEDIHNQAREQYTATQDAYARFMDKNRDLSRRVSMVELTNLKIRMDLAGNYYTKMTQQLQLARNRVAKLRPVYAVIEPAKVPLKPASPRKGIIMAGFLFFSAALGYGWVWFKTNYLKPLPR